MKRKRDIKKIESLVNFFDSNYSRLIDITDECFTLNQDIVFPLIRNLYDILLILKHKYSNDPGYDICKEKLDFIKEKASFYSELFDRIESNYQRILTNSYSL